MVCNSGDIKHWGYKALGDIKESETFLWTYGVYGFFYMAPPYGGSHIKKTKSFYTLSL